MLKSRSMGGGEQEWEAVLATWAWGVPLFLSLSYFIT